MASEIVSVDIEIGNGGLIRGPLSIKSKDGSLLLALDEHAYVDCKTHSDPSEKSSEAFQCTVFAQENIE